MMKIKCSNKDIRKMGNDRLLDELEKSTKYMHYDPNDSTEVCIYDYEMLRFEIYSRMNENYDY